MIKVSFSGKNIKLEWELISEKRRIEKLKNRIPRYEIDADGDSVLSSYEFPQASIRDILEAFDVEELLPDSKVQKTYRSVSHRVYSYGQDGTGRVGYVNVSPST